MTDILPSHPLVLTTGTAGSLGQGVAQTLLNSGYNVLGTMLYHQHTPELEPQPGFFRAILDVLDPVACKAFIEDMDQPLRMAVCMVGGFATGGLADTDLEQVHKMIRMNFESCFTLVKEVFEKMKRDQSGGHIVLIGAKPAIDPATGRFAWAYTLSKSLVHAFAQMLEAEGKPHGIRCALMVPGIIDTPPNRAAMPDADFEAWASPEEIGKVIAFLGSEDAIAVREAIVKVYKDG